MRTLYSLALAAAFLLPGTSALADTVSATTVSYTSTGNAYNYIYLNALASTAVADGGTFSQTGRYYDYSPTNGTKSFSFSDTFTINGITETLIFTATDSLTNAYDRLVIDAMSNIAFGSVLVSFSPVTVTAYSTGTYAFNLTGTVADQTTQVTPVTAVTSEPSSVLLLFTGLLGVAGLVLKRRGFLASVTNRLSA